MNLTFSTGGQLVWSPHPPPVVHHTEISTILIRVSQKHCPEGESALFQNISLQYILNVTV